MPPNTPGKTIKVSRTVFDDQPSGRNNREKNYRMSKSAAVNNEHVLKPIQRKDSPNISESPSAKKNGQNGCLKTEKNMEYQISIQKEDSIKGTTERPTQDQLGKTSTLQG